jgi:hypothetical protein
MAARHWDFNVSVEQVVPTVRALEVIRSIRLRFQGGADRWLATSASVGSSPATRAIRTLAE